MLAFLVYWFSFYLFADCFYFFSVPFSIKIWSLSKRETPIIMMSVSPDGDLITIFASSVNLECTETVTKKSHICFFLLATEIENIITGK